MKNEVTTFAVFRATFNCHKDTKFTWKLFFDPVNYITKLTIVEGKKVYIKIIYGKRNYIQESRLFAMV